MNEATEAAVEQAEAPIMSFNDVVIPEEEAHENEAEDVKEPVKIKVGDEELSEEEVKEALKSHKNKNEWDKSNAEKARELAVARTGLKAMTTFIEKLRSSGERLPYIKEAFMEEFGDEFETTFEEALKADLSNIKDPRDDELAALKAEKAAIENEKEIKAEKKELAEKFKLNDEQTDEVYAFAVKKFEETGQALSLEEAYKLMDYDKALERAAEAEKKAKEAKKPTPPKIPSTRPGATKIIDKNRYRSFKDIPTPP